MFRTILTGTRAECRNAGMFEIVHIVLVAGQMLLASCGSSSAVGTCVCSCTITGVGITSTTLTGNYTQSECNTAAVLVESGGTNECGNFTDGSVVCSSSWTESS
jgi:hypothetical protein